MPKKGFTPSDREYLATLADVVFGNAFSPQRAKLIHRLAPGIRLEEQDALAQVVGARLGSLAGAATDKDRELLEPALLYVNYHRCVAQLDALIDRQARQGGEPVTVPFADEVIGALVRSGFAEARAVRYFALYFQLRRAFYFIAGGLVGQCESMGRMREALWDNIFTRDMRRYEAGLWSRMEDFSTLLLGETGTGKGSAAAAIGRSEFIPYLTERRRFATNFAESFISINISQFPESLVESELFGHRKGAFTGAVEDHAGVFARCSAHGALFLDEIGEVPVPVQIKLLQVLQERVFVPLGSHERKRFAGRVIAATNRPLTELRDRGRFRADFYYRLCSDVIEVPTLRQRIRESRAELAQLVRQVVERMAGDASQAGFVLEALERDLPDDYAWPGNVRELEQAVRRILLTGRYLGDGPAAEGGDEDDRLVARMREGALTADELLAGYAALLHRRHGSYAEVAKRAGLDPRTSRKYVLAGKAA